MNLRTSVISILAMCGSFSCGDDSSTGAGGGSTSATSTHATGATNGSTGQTTSATSSTSTGTMHGACAGTGAEITELPACAGNTSSPVAVASGCDPTFDGTLHADEWADGTCFTAGGATVVVKYGSDALYMAMSSTPSCGCPMSFVFDPDGGGAANGNEFSLGLFDDPFNADGDRVDSVLTNGHFVNGSAPAGIVTMCPGNQPSPIRYEIKIPFSAVGITAGTQHDVGFAFVHSGSGNWPAGLVLDADMSPTDPTSYGKLSSSWQ